METYPKELADAKKYLIIFQRKNDRWEIVGHECTRCKTSLKRISTVANHEKFCDNIYNRLPDKVKNQGDNDAT